MIYRDVYFYTKRSNFETHLSKSFLLVQIHNLELLSFKKNIWFIGVFIKTTNSTAIRARTVLKGG